MTERGQGWRENTAPRAEASRRRIAAAVAAACTVPVGFWLKYGRVGRWTSWTHAHGAGAAYVAFWTFVLRAWAPQMRAGTAAAAVLAVTCCLEFLQTVSTPWLDAVRRTTLGAWLLGEQFDAADIPWYGVGALAAYVLLRWLDRRECGGGGEENGEHLVTRN